MKNDQIYSTTYKILKNCHNQPLEMTIGDLVDELERLHAIPKETAWQMRLAIMHREQENLDHFPYSPLM